MVEQQRARLQRLGAVTPHPLPEPTVPEPLPPQQLLAETGAPPTPELWEQPEEPLPPMPPAEQEIVRLLGLPRQ